MVCAASRIDEKTSGNDLNKDAKQLGATRAVPINIPSSGGDTTPRSVRLEISPAHYQRDIMFLKVTLTNDFELYLNLNEVCAWRPYNGKVDPADLVGCCIVDLTSGGNFRLNKESSEKFIALFDRKTVPGFFEPALTSL